MIVSLSPKVARMGSEGWNANEGEWCNELDSKSVATSLEANELHIFTVPSADLDATRHPSNELEIDSTLDVCPSRTASWYPVCLSHFLIV
jgi:hypothetical protein